MSERLLSQGKFSDDCTYQRQGKMGSFTLSASLLSRPSRLGPSPATHLSRPLLPSNNPFTLSSKSKPTTLTASNLGCFSCKSTSSMAETAPATSENKPKLLVFDTEEELCVSLAKYTADLSEKFGKDRGSFSVVLSGGSLIKSLRKLLEAPYFDSIDWGKWHVFWVDERVVPKDHVDSNYKLAYDGFLSKVPIPPGNVYSINDALPAEGAADDYETFLRQLVKSTVVEVSSVSCFPKFDLMLLGMGPDGHVASLFPGHPLVNENQRWVTFIKDSPKPPPERITFTFPVINSSAYIAMVVTGAGKADAVQKALGSNEGAAPLPAGRVLAEDETVWFTDKAAASKLQDTASL